jgi:MFS family permease
LIGPGLAGAIIHALTAPFAILLDAICFFISAIMLRSIPPAPTDVPKLRTDSFGWGGIWKDAKEGLVMIWHTPILRSIAISLMAWNLLKHAYLAILILFATRDLALTAGEIGILFMAAGVGFLIASATCQWFNHRYGVGPIMLTGLSLSGISWLIVATVTREHVTMLHFGFALFFFDFGAMLFFINYLTLRQAVTPDHLRGRVTSTLIFIAVSLSPVGSLLGGVVGELFGLRTTIAIAGVGGIVLGLALLRYSPLKQMRELPALASPPTRPPVTPHGPATSTQIAAE